jgi:hypothetical protein
MQETRIWHTKRPLYIGALVLLILVVLGVLVTNAARSVGEEEEPVPVEPEEELVEESEVIEDPYSEQEGPTETGGPSSGSIILGLGETGEVAGVSITPRRIVEESRCPADVNCIQAGRVVVAVDVEGDSLDIEEGQTREVSGVTITLSDVSPGPLSTDPIEGSEYRFTFSVAR